MSAANSYCGVYEPVKLAAKRLSTTAKYLRVLCLENVIPGAHKRYCWEGNWLRMRWHIPINFEMAYGGRQIASPPTATNYGGNDGV